MSIAMTSVEDLYLFSGSMKSDAQHPIQINVNNNIHEYRKRQHSDSSDDDASSPKSHSPSMDDDRRAHHNELERKRRDHIKDHFMILKDSIPLLDGEKSSRALILKRAVEYISVMQSRLNENNRSIEELRRKNELLEDKLKDREPSVSPINARIPTIAPQASLPLPSLSIPTLSPAVTSMPQNASPAALSAMDPTHLNNLIVSSQEAIVALTQSLLGKMHTGPVESITPPTLFANTYMPQPDRQMAVRF